MPLHSVCRGKNSKSLQRTKRDSDSDLEIVTALTPSWPHFVVMTDVDSDSGRLKTISPFIVSWHLQHCWRTKERQIDQIWPSHRG